MLARAFFQHDHNTCQSNALARARAHCADHNLIFTPIREAVLRLLLETHKPWGAYEIIAAMKEGGRKIQAPSIYRALDFLVTNGLAHRIESLNAFVGCTEDHGRMEPIFFLCDGCGRVAESGSSGLDAVMKNLARDNGFAVAGPVLEIRGQCPSCQEMAIAAE